MATATFSDSTRLLIGRDTTRCAAARTTGDSPPPSFPTAMARRAGAFRVSGSPPASAAHSGVVVLVRKESTSSHEA